MEETYSGIQQAATLIATPIPNDLTKCERFLREKHSAQEKSFAFLSKTGYNNSQLLELLNKLGEKSDEVEKIRTELIKKQGKELLRKMAKNSTIEEYAKAAYMAHYGTMEYRTKMISFVQWKSVEAIIEVIGCNSQNPADQKIFTRMTGVKLGRTQKERVEQIRTWAETAAAK